MLALHADGSIVTGFPVVLVKPSAANVNSTPTTADVDGDGDLDICSKAWNGDLHIYLRNMLVERGGGFIVTNEEECSTTAGNLLRDERIRTTAGERASSFVQSHLGATEQILQFIEPHLTTRSNGTSQ